MTKTKLKVSHKTPSAHPTRLRPPSPADAHDERLRDALAKELIGVCVEGLKTFGLNGRKLVELGAQESDGNFKPINITAEVRKRSAGCMVVDNIEDVDRYLGQVRDAAARIHAWIAAQTGDPLDLLRRMKFETVGFHPVQGHALNVVEQINQTWTYVVALAAARHLLELHPEAGGYLLAPGANAVLELDIMSKAPGLVGAETFAAVDPRNNNKLETDLQKLAGRTEQHRYLFFMSPCFPGFKRLPQWECNGIQVWSIDV